jgi:SAM-dependent methyltransferase
MQEIDQNQESVSLDQYINNIESELNEILMDPAASGYDSLMEQDIAYGVSFTIGINTTTDVVLDVGCGLGEFYYYVERFTNEKLYKYYGIDNIEEYLDINKFRSNQDDTVNLMNFDINDFEDGFTGYADDALRNLSILGNINDNIDWVVMCNVINEDFNTSQIINKIKFWSKVPEKGAVFTFKLDSQQKLADVASAIVLDDVLNNKTIIRSDFYKNWISVYVYNSRV